MANHKSALKRMRQSETRRIRNRHVNSQLKTVLKTFYSAVDAKTAGAEMTDIHRLTVSKIYRAATRGIMHKRTAARKVSRITAYMQKAQEPAAAATE